MAEARPERLHAFITAQMGKQPDAIFCDVFGGDFVTLAKQAAPLGYFKAVNNRLVDGGEVGTTDAALALGADYPYGIWSDAYDPVIWPGNEPAEHKAFIVERSRPSPRSPTARAGRSWATARSSRSPTASRRPATRTRTRWPRRCSGSPSTRRSASGPSTPRPHETAIGRILGPDGQGRALSRSPS